MQHHNNKIDAALLGKIVLARFLELPLRAVDRLAAQMESSAGFTALRPWVSVGRLEGAQVAHEAADIPQTRASPILEEVHEERDAPTLRMTAWVRAPCKGRVSVLLLRNSTQCSPTLPHSAAAMPCSLRVGVGNEPVDFSW